MKLSRGRLATAMLVALVVSAGAIFLLSPPITQDPHYHQFADRRTLFGIPNFWNVVSNAPFLGAALFGWRALRSPSSFVEPWERQSYAILLVATAMVAFGSAYYHLHPDNRTLFWDRLPMTFVFMSLFASTLGERFSSRVGRWSLFPLLALGLASVIVWRISGDLRMYGVVQFYPMIAIPLLLVLLPPRYTGTAGLFVTMLLYGLAKALELFDSKLAAIVSTGGHPWKHIAAAAALIVYCGTVANRRPVPTDREI